MAMLLLIAGMLDVVDDDDQQKQRKVEMIDFAVVECCGEELKKDPFFCYFDVNLLRFLRKGTLLV